MLTDSTTSARPTGGNPLMTGVKDSNASVETDDDSFVQIGHDLLFSNLFTSDRRWANDARLSFEARGFLFWLSAQTVGSEFEDDEIRERASVVKAEVLESVQVDLTAAGYLKLARPADHPDGPSYDLMSPWPTHPPSPAAVSEYVPPRVSEVVYYLRRDNGDIKIGFTRELAKRWATLERQYGPLVLLAAEPGGWHLEQRRHALFSDARKEGEWFGPGGKLAVHIGSLAVSGGDR